MAARYHTRSKTLRCSVKVCTSILLCSSVVAVVVMSQVQDLIGSPLSLDGLVKNLDVYRPFAATPADTEEQEQTQDECKPQYHDPFDKTAMEYTHIEMPFPCHHEESSLTRVERGATLIINSTLVTSLGAQKFRCFYRAILRQSEDSFSFSDPKIFESGYTVPLVTDGVQVRCSYSTNVTVMPKLYGNIHYIMTEKPDIEKKMQHRMLERQQRSTSDNEINRTGKAVPSDMNVLIVGIDSVSRFNMIRTMNRTRQFLLKRLHAVDFVNFNKIGDNTLPNFFGFLTGRTIEEAGYRSDQYADTQGFRFLWQDFEDEGFRTMYLETSLNAFRYAQKGFASQPTHHYPCIVENAKEKNRPLFTHDGNCFQGISNDQLMLDNTVEFARLYRHKPHFGLVWLQRATHDHLNGGSRVDEHFDKFLSQMLTENLLNNTLLVVVSDHGYRMGDFMTTSIGKFEANQPFLYLAFPTWFAETYPLHMEHVKTNAARLTTPLDLHTTLRDVLYLNNKVSFVKQSFSKHGVSFFEQIPKNRTCADAGIPLPFCECLSGRAIPTTLPIAQQAGEAMVASLNAAMNDSQVMDVCHTLELSEVQEVRVLEGGRSYRDTFCSPKKGNTTDNNWSQLLRLTVVTKPGGAVCEGTVVKCDNSTSFRRVGDVTRRNMYGTTSHCVKDRILKKVCYCKDQLVGQQ